MKSSEVYKLLREEVGPWSKVQSFKPTKTMLSWQRPQGDNYIVFWFQVSRDGWDEYAGSKFTVEFQVSREPIVGAMALRRRRLGKLLTNSALEELRAIQNGVIASLRKPPPDYYVLQLTGSTRDWYTQKFQLVTTPYSEDADIWLRYHTADHVRSWGRFVLGQLPECIGQAEDWR